MAARRLRRILPSVALVGLVAGATAVTVTSPAAAGHINTIAVTPLTVFPAFDEGTYDYAVRCDAGDNLVDVVVDSPTATQITVDGSAVASGASTPVTVAEDEAIVVGVRRFGITHEYWYRCLPADFPAYTVDKPGTPGPGYYLMAFGLCITSCPTTGGSFLAIVDTNGVPVWHKRTRLPVIDQKLRSDGTLAFVEFLPRIAPGPVGYQVNRLDGSLVNMIRADAPSTDPHELLELENGNDLIFSYLTREHADMTSIGLSNDETVIDGLIQELDADGNMVWEWNSKDHVAPDESILVPGNLDLIHLNSAEELPGGDLLISGRSTGVHRIDRSTGDVMWKLGGTTTAESLTVIGDSYPGPLLQHDARILPDGTITIFDNRAGGRGAARVVNYEIDTAASPPTATLLWEYTNPLGQSAGFIGSARRQPDGNTVIDWGAADPQLEEVDAAGNQLLVIDGPGEQMYRGIKYPLSTWSIDTLRANSGGIMDTDAPIEVTAEAGNGQATVAWTEPVGGQPITGYTVRSRPEDKRCTSTGELSCIVEDLTPGETYSFVVWATNIWGSSLGSLPTNEITIPFPPDAPQAVDGVAGDGEVAVSWTAPASDGGAPITAYDVTASPGGATCSTTGELTCTVGGLTNGSPYTFDVTATNVAGTGPASTSGSVTPVAVPGAPGSVTGVVGDGEVDVSWTVPASNGGAPITDYDVTASPGGATCSTTVELTCTVTGLTNGTPYTFSATATNDVGTGPAGASAPVTPVATFITVPPVRIKDTRDDVQPRAGSDGASKVGSADGSAPPLRLNVHGLGGLPSSGIDAVSLNVTAVDGERPNVGGGYVTVDDCETPRPTVSNLNFGQGQTVANAVITPVSATGEICVYLYGTADILIDVNGYFPTGSRYDVVGPERVWDTRLDGPGKVGATNGSGQPLRISLFGEGGLPTSGIAAVSLNVTAADGERPDIGGGYVTVDDCETPRPVVSNINFAHRQTVPNAVITPVSATGEICVYVYGLAHIIVDVNGYFPTGSKFMTVGPVRLKDTRGGTKVGSPDGSAGPLVFNVAGLGGLPASGIKAVSLNVTATETQLPVAGVGFVTVDPCGNPRPIVSNLNFLERQTIPNAVITPVSASGEICIYVYGLAHILIDVNGYL